MKLISLNVNVNYDDHSSINSNETKIFLTACDKVLGNLRNLYLSSIQTTLICPIHQWTNRNVQNKKQFGFPVFVEQTNESLCRIYTIYLYLFFNY